MSATAPPFPRLHRTAAEWVDALGGVPLERIIMDPPPGTATEKDLLQYVDGAGREKRLCELVDGTLVEKPVGYWEGVIAQNLIMHLLGHVRAKRLGLVNGEGGTLRMVYGNVRIPDVSFISAARAPKSRAPVPAVSPDLAVEVLSDSNTAAEMLQKRHEYFQSGTRLVWMIDPKARTVTIYRGPEEVTRTLTEADALDGEDVVPGFTMPVGDLFLDVPPLE
jgi:Uma2 family endonuclease